MEFKKLSSGVKIPVLGLGTWQMGGGLRPSYANDRKDVEAIRYAIKVGITHVDTAEIYGGGHAEELVGEAVKGFGRKDLFITTKVSPHHLGYDQILKSCQRSLLRLGLEYVDLYLLHWPNPLASMRKAMAAFDKLVTDGLVRFIGVSNFSLKQLKNAQSYTKNKIVTNQVEYSLLERRVEGALLPFCQREGIILTAYTPLAKGHLAQKGFKPLDKMAAKYKKTPAQVALRWLIEKSQVIVIPKASSKEHIDEILGAVDWRLSKEDQEYLSREF